MDLSKLMLYRFIESLPSLLSARGDAGDEKTSRQQSVQRIVHFAQVLEDMGLGARALEDALGKCEDVLKKLRAQIMLDPGLIELTNNEKHIAGLVFVNIEESLWRLRSAAEMLSGVRKPSS